MDNNVTSRFFASGSNRIGEIRGISSVGRNVGVSVNEVHPRQEAALAALVATAILVFADSGAFGEVKFNAPHKCSKKSDRCQAGECLGNGNLPFPEAPACTFVVVKPIDDAEWDARIGVQERLAAALGVQLFVVAPDKVGDQKVTLERLARYADRMRGMRELGANIIVAMQKGDVEAGELTLTQFDDKVEEILGFGDFVRGIPSKKNTTTVAELREYAKALRAKGATRVHLLGMGVKSGKAFEKRLAVLDGFEVYSDSVRICAMVGRPKGKAPRLLTCMQDAVRAENGLAAEENLTDAMCEEAVRRAFTVENEELGFAPHAAAKAA